MTTHVSTRPAAGLDLSVFGRFFRFVAEVFTLTLQARSHLQAFEKYSRMSDEDLSAQGLRREDLPRQIIEEGLR